MRWRGQGQGQGQGQCQGEGHTLLFNGAGSETSCQTWHPVTLSLTEIPQNLEEGVDEDSGKELKEALGDDEGGAESVG